MLTKLNPDKEHGPDNSAWMSLADRRTVAIERLATLMIAAGHKSTLQLRARLAGLSNARRQQIRVQYLGKMHQRTLAAHADLILDPLRRLVNARSLRACTLSQITGIGYATVREFMHGGSLSLPSVNKLIAALDIRVKLSQ